MKRLKLFIPLFVFVALAILFWFGLRGDPTDLPSALIGKVMPDFEMQTVQPPQRTVTAADMKGHDFALINVWATWCAPCRQEHPFLVSLAEQGVPIFGVNTQDQLDLAQQWLEERGDPYVFSVFDDNGKLSLDLGVYGYPETFLIDSRGTVLKRKKYILSPQVWENEFLPLIAQIPDDNE